MNSAQLSVNVRLARLHLIFREFGLAHHRLSFFTSRRGRPHQGRPDVFASTSFLPTAKCQPFDFVLPAIAREALKTYLP